MKLPAFIYHRLVRYAAGLTFSRSPDEILGQHEAPFMLRWYAIRHNRWFNIYVHHWLRSDDDRALHDHPWVSCSLLLAGSYREHLPDDKSEKRIEGHIYFRRAKSAHRIELVDAYAVGHKQQVLTMFITGPHVREWGFLCAGGWRHWKFFTKEIAKGKSIGCGDFG